MNDSDVKPTRWQRFCQWLDGRPRLGWYLAAWMFLVSTETTVNYLDWLLQLLS